MSGWRFFARLFWMALCMMGALVVAILAPVYLFALMYMLFSR